MLRSLRVWGVVLMRVLRTGPITGVRMESGINMIWVLKKDVGRMLAG